MQEIVGRVVGNHQLAERLGGGAMGDVYRGRHVGLDLDRAVKILAPDLARDPTYVSLFAREARVAAGLRHPNIVQIFDVGTDQGLHYIAMELLEGSPLNRVLAQRRSFRPHEALPLLEQLASALDYAHERGVIHRDVKPSNVMIGSNGHLTLVDFGIARASESTGMTQTRTSGTPYYMAPEVWRGEGGTRGADLYALGVLVYELLVGHVPFRGPTHVAVMHAHIYEPPPTPRTVGVTLPSAVEAVLLRQLAKEPEARYPSAGAMVAALRRAVELGDRVQAARAALVAGDFARASAVGGALAIEAPDDPDVQALHADLAVASQRAGLLDGTRQLIPNRLAGLGEPDGGRSGGGHVHASADQGRAETRILTDLTPQRDDRATDRTQSLSLPSSDSEIRRWPADRRLVLFGAPLVALGLTVSAVLWLARSGPAPEPAPLATVTPMPPTTTPTAVVAAVEPTPTLAFGPDVKPTAPPPPTATPPPTQTPAQPTPTRLPATSTPVPSTSIPNVPAGPPGTVLLSDNFDNPAGAKLDPSGYEGGEYVVRRRGHGSVMLPWDMPNVSIAVDARVQGDNYHVAVALSCRASIAENNRMTGVGRYTLIVFPWRRQAFVRLLYEGKVPRSEPTPADAENPAVRPGNESNHLELDCIGDTITARVNGQQIATFTDRTITTGKVDLGLTSTYSLPNPPTFEVRFDNLVITQR